MSYPYCFSMPAILRPGNWHSLHLLLSALSLLLLLAVLYFLTSSLTVLAHNRTLPSLASRSLRNAMLGVQQLIARSRNVNRPLTTKATSDDSRTKSWAGISAAFVNGWRMIADRRKSHIPVTTDRRGTGYFMPIVFSVVCCGILAYAATRVPNYPIYEYRNVAVLQQVAPNKWMMEWNGNKTLWNGCPDFPNAEVIWAGYVMAKFRYEDQGRCKSILGSDLGVWYLRDDRGNAIEIKEHASRNDDERYHQ
jgi:hypothetical protein